MACCNRLVLSSSSTQTSDKRPVLGNSISQLKIRTNIHLPIPIEIYVPDNDESVQYAFMLGMHTIRTVECCEKALLSGYFSALCAVLPHLTKLSYEILESLGFQAKEIMVPSQKDVKLTKIPHLDYRTEVLSFAQLIYLPLTFNLESVKLFWSEVAQSAGISPPIYLFPESDVKTLLLAFKASGSGAKLHDQIHLSRRALCSSTSMPFGLVFSQARQLVSLQQTFSNRAYVCME